MESDARPVLQGGLSRPSRWQRHAREFDVLNSYFQRRPPLRDKTSFRHNQVIISHTHRFRDSLLEFEDNEPFKNKKLPSSLKFTLGRQDHQPLRLVPLLNSSQVRGGQVLWQDGRDSVRLLPLCPVWLRLTGLGDRVSPGAATAHPQNLNH